MEELGYKVDIDTLLFDAADRAVLGRQVFQLSVPIKAAFDFCLRVDEPRHIASSAGCPWQRLYLRWLRRQGLRVVPFVLVVRVLSAGVWYRLHLSA